MSVHKLQIIEESGEVSLKLVCSAIPGADCRKRPTDDREEWSVGDPDLVLVDGDCWAVEWVSAVGWEDAVRMNEGTGVVVSVPVDVGYEEGVLLSVASAHPELDGLESRDSSAPVRDVQGNFLAGNDEERCTVCMGPAGDDSRRCERLALPLHGTHLVEGRYYMPTNAAEINAAIGEPHGSDSGGI